MKFARYLAENATPEWRRAYVDYKRLKKILKNVVKAREAPSPPSQPVVPGGQASPLTERVDRADYGAIKSGTPSRTPSRVGSVRRVRSARSLEAAAGAEALASEEEEEEGQREAEIRRRRRESRREGAQPRERKDALTSAERSPRLEEDAHGSGRSDSHLIPPQKLQDRIRSLPPADQQFFAALDQELEKVDSFYLEREAEAQQRWRLLSQQLAALAQHRKAFYSKGPASWWAALKSAWQDPKPSVITRTLRRKPPRTDWHLPGEGEEEGEEGEGEGGKAGLGKQVTPETYKYAQRKLKAAVFELHRFLELLKNFRILNRTAFIKALKKYDKATRLHMSPLYMSKVDQRAFATSPRLENMLNSVEHAFATYFEHGSRKKALARLRVRPAVETHHDSTFLSGIFLGLSIPGFVIGLDRALDPSIQARLPQWPALLQIYGACLIPPLFALLFTINMHAWVLARINYVFIFEFDVRHVLDHRQFAEIPSFLILLLSWSFYLTFNLSWPDQIAPWVWPLAWLVTVCVIFLNPLPIFFHRTRWWFIRSLARVVAAGVKPVEFRDFFIGDELNSVYYAIYNLFLLGCAYDQGWPPNVYGICSPNRHWPTPVLMSLPALSRFFQSLRRFSDSDFKMRIHLINAGKYASSIITFFFYFCWRYHGTRHDDEWFALFIVFSTISSFYTCSWDLLMDWSLLQRGAKYPLLRNELAYDFVPAYYFAMFSNIIIRFIWVWYLPPGGLSLNVRAWIFAMLEMLRRWQWNFFRVENEHLGNVDAYRVMRDVSLPYHPSQTGVSERPASPASDISKTEGRPTARRMLSGQRAEGGARGRPAAKDYERKRHPAEEDSDEEEDDSGDSPAEEIPDGRGDEEEERQRQRARERSGARSRHGDEMERGVDSGDASSSELHFVGERPAAFDEGK